MKSIAVFSLTLACALSAAVIFAPLARADVWNRRTVVTFNAPIEIPGMVLGKGTYVMKLADSPWNRDVVQFFNASETHIYNTVMAIPVYRSQPTEKTVITFEERATGSPEAIHDWYYPGDLRGEEFIYPKAQRLVATSQNTNLAPRPKPAPAPAPIRSQITPPVQPPAQVAQAKPTPPASQQTPPPAAPAAPAKELPKTASDLPLFGVAGLLAAAGGLWLRRKTA